MTKYLYDCQFCGFPTDHPSRTCVAHRDLQPPIAGLDEPYFLDAPYEHELHSPDDADRP